MGINNPPGGNRGKSFEDNLEKYQVYSAIEIGRILRGIQSNKQMVRMGFSGSPETLITNVLDVDVDRKSILLDASPIAAQNEIAFKSDMSSFEAVLDKIKISFVAGKITPDRFDGALAFRVPFPERLVRLQRREFFRVQISNAVIHIPLEAEGMVQTWMGTVRDLSTNGACLVDTSKALDHTVGMIYSNCRLELPETQLLSLTLEVRNSYEVTLPDSSRQRRLGCQFVNISASEEALIQRYITRAERQRKALTD